MTNPNPLIITNKFPSWIIQDKNQPPSSGRARHLTSSGWFISVFWRKHLFSYSGCQPSSPAPETVPESSPAQPRGQAHKQSRQKKNKTKERVAGDVTLCQCVICHVSSDLCHLRGPIFVSSWHPRDITETLTQCHSANTAPEATPLKYFRLMMKIFLLHAGKL